MKRMILYIANNKIFLLAVVVTIISACSNDNDDIQNTQPTGAATIIEATPENSNVPIRFDKSTGFTTRASYLNSHINNNYLGVFCVASQGIEGTANSDIVWDGSAGSTTQNALNLWMINAQAKIEASIAEDGEGTLTWLDGNNYYYPKANSTYKFAYSFAAYYPYTDQVKTASNAINIIYTGLDGNTDVVTAMSSIDNDEDGNGQPDEDNDLAQKAYSASYFENGGMKKPKFAFRHRMSRLIMRMRLSDSYTGTKEFWVNDVRISNLPDSVHVPIIALAKSGNTANVSNPDYLRVYTGSTNTYVLRDGQGNSLSQDTSDSWKLTTVNKQIGNGIIIPPLCSGTIYTDNDEEVTDAAMLTDLMKLNFGLQLRDGDSNTYNFQATVNPPTNGWESGKQYLITLIITPNDGDTGPDAQSQTDPSVATSREWIE